MSQLKKFEKNGNQYIMKKQYGFGLFIVLAMAAFAIGCLWYGKYIGAVVFLVLTVLCALSVLQDSFLIDLDQRHFVVKNGLIRKPTTIQFSDFVNFELYKLKQNFITTNVSLNMYYIKDNEEKSIGIAQGFLTSSMQKLINEIYDILELDGNSGKI
ncbi:hypothetical protein [Flavobacterium foetidum]|uniref:hypothetical protein n=1 Tax=Flavobacterium foetidum TaxID=2026681 RepID=UPI00107539CC|nr:hypothetical protein [Flavobacterium foetidum]KAF2508288.1 hypothetical protein E0W73_19770 [Flavobacterium foetidum]